MRLACPKCHQRNPNNPVLVNEMTRYVDAEGFVAAKVLCPGCGFNADIRVTQETPPCSRCGHVDRRLLRGDPKLRGATDDPQKVLEALRGPDAPF